ncbi:MAG: DUF2314 domain-containing protein [Planctomycetota bacterium]
MLRTVASLIVFLSLIGCERRSKYPEAAAPEPVAAKAADSSTESQQGTTAKHGPVPAGSLVEDVVFIEFAVYLLEDLEKDLKAEAEAAAREHAGALKVTTFQNEDPELPALVFHEPEISEYRPPDAESIRFSSRGLSEEESKKAPNAKQVLVLTAMTTAPQADSVHRQMLTLTDHLARKLSGLAWDEATRQVFSHQAWNDERLTWKSGPPQLSEHITMHAYRSGPLIRIVTLGMSKFGLPEVVVNDVPSGSTRGIGNLINLVCQTIYERPRLETSGVLEVSIDRVDNPKTRDVQQTNILDNAKRSAVLIVEYTAPEEGDAENRLIEIVFGNAEGGESPQVAQDRTLSELYGSSDEISMVSHDDELQAASERARTEVLKLKPTFADGPDLNEELLVKAPFETESGGTEWMWVEVVTWKDKQILGILTNDPFEIPDLHAGARVEVDEELLFDYIHRRPDGTQVGNETGEIVRRKRTSSRKK